MNTAISNDTQGITIIIAYYGTDTRFDRTYYVEQHLPLVERSWKQYGFRSGIALFPEPDDRGILAMAACTFRDEAAISACFNSPESTAVMADVINYTDSSPVQNRLAAIETF